MPLSSCSDPVSGLPRRFDRKHAFTFARDGARACLCPMRVSNRLDNGKGRCGMVDVSAALPYPYINLVADPSACVRLSFTVITSDLT